jgi:hypothetical protein
MKRITFGVLAVVAGLTATFGAMFAFLWIMVQMDQGTPIGLVLGTLVLGAIVAGVIASNINYYRNRRSLIR